MTKKNLTILWILILLAFVTIPITAGAVSTQIHDDAALLSKSEIQALETKADMLMSDYGMDVVILTLDSLDGRSAQSTADQFYDDNQYADNGVLFLLAMKEREWYISTCGTARFAVSDYALYEIENEILPYMSEGAYFEAFDSFLDSLPDYFAAYADTDLSGGYDHYTQEYEYTFALFGPDSIFISLGVGLAVAFITVSVMRGSMNTKRRQRGAVDYLKSGSYHLRTNQDLFLYSRVSKQKRQENTNSHSAGSSSHRSSGGFSGGGRSHGGGGGRF